MTKLTGLIAAPHTPFDANGEVNYPVIDRIAEHLIVQGVKGAYVCGTTGEGIHCSVEERKKIAERWVAASQGQLSITLHTGALSIADRASSNRQPSTIWWNIAVLSPPPRRQKASITTTPACRV